MEFQSRYEFNPKTDLLGKGGYSKVYKAWDQLLDRDVALKFFGADVSEKYGILNLIKKVIRFEHPNLCNYYDVAVLDTQNVMGETERVEVGILEYLDGGDIRKFVGHSPEYTDRLLVDVLQGLSYLHKKGMVHGDLKPQNVLVKRTEDGPVAKITDFGISNLIDSSALMGTLEYMAPEQFNPEKYGVAGRIATNIDLWSFGLLVYELAAQKPLFGSRSSGISVEQVMTDILSDAPLAKLDVLPARYKAVVQRCLVKNAAERVQAAAELIPLFSLNGEQSLPAGLSKGTEAPPVPEARRIQAPTAQEQPADAKSQSEATHRPAGLPGSRQVLPLPELKTVQEEAKPARESSFSGARAPVGKLQATQQAAVEAPPSPVEQAARHGNAPVDDRERPEHDWGEKKPVRPKNPMGRRTPSYIKRRNKRKAVAAVVLGLVLVAGIVAFQSAWKGTGADMAGDDPAIVQSGSVASEMVRVEGGQFRMGSDAQGATPEEQPVHTVSVQPFYISKYEVTIGEFRQFVQETGYVTDAEKEGWSSVYQDGKWSKPNDANKINWRYDYAGNLIDSNVTDIPVVHVSWNDAINYCQWLSLNANSLYRLPTEEEWEYAARGGSLSGSYRFSGSNTPREVAWYGGNSEGTLHAVGQKKPNELGIHDMSGNAMEWCGSSYKMYRGGPQEVTTSNSDKVLRGGSWYYGEDWCRSTFRRGWPPNMRGGAIGFRVCREEK